jgi:DNA-binding NtrC family response regulator
VTTKVLLIDDEELFREDLAGLLRRRDMECRTAASGEQGLAALADWDADIVLCDIMMPGMGGIDALDGMMRLRPDLRVIMLTAHADLDTAITAFRKGACDYVMKPIVFEDVAGKIRRLAELKELTREVQVLRRQASRDLDSLSIVGQSESMKTTMRHIGEVAATRSTVLITGESGTGKELAARTIHGLGETKDRPFVAINCAGIPEALLESELFGHVRGAFTGAVGDRSGYFELAGNGTILLDEIGEMPMMLQAKLLRVLEQKEFTPVGSTKVKPLGARIIAATNKDLRNLAETGRFRTDLYFRVAVFELPMPPLRDRRSDIPALVEHLVHKLNGELKRQCLGLSSEAMRCLLAYSWPGNVRELRNVIERAMILGRGGYITPAELPENMCGNLDAAATATPDDLRSAVRFFERDFLLRVIAECDGNKEEAARRMNINPSTLYRKLTDLDIKPRASDTVAS